MERIISSFSVTGKKQEEVSGGPPESDSPEMEKVLAEMERDFGGMDEENPDPRQLARMMRKMSSVTGEKMPETMEEMIKRMEAGEDPEKLEAEYGDALEDLDPGTPDAGAESPDSKKAPTRRRSRVVRDPTLYEMAEYV